MKPESAKAVRFLQIQALYILQSVEHVIALNVFCRRVESSQITGLFVDFLHHPLPSFFFIRSWFCAIDSAGSQSVL